MALKVTNSEVDGVSVLTLDGRIVLGEETRSYCTTLRKTIMKQAI